MSEENWRRSELDNFYYDDYCPTCGVLKALKRHVRGCQEMRMPFGDESKAPLTSTPEQPIEYYQNPPRDYVASLHATIEAQQITIARLGQALAALRAHMQMQAKAIGRRARRLQELAAVEVRQ